MHSYKGAKKVMGRNRFITFFVARFLELYGSDRQERLPRFPYP